MKDKQAINSLSALAQPPQGHPMFLAAARPPVRPHIPVPRQLKLAPAGAGFKPHPLEGSWQGDAQLALWGYAETAANAQTPSGIRGIAVRVGKTRRSTGQKAN